MSAGDSSMAVAATAADPTRGRGLKKVALALLALGLLVTVIGFVDAQNRGRLAYGYLLAFVFVWTVVLGAVFFVALQHVTGSIWSVVIRRVAEMFASPMWLVSILFVPILLIALMPGDDAMFPWAHAGEAAEHGAAEHGAESATADPHGEAAALQHALDHKAPYLNMPFFIARSALFFLIWILFAAFFVRNSIRQDDGQAGPEASGRMRRLAAPFLVIFGITVTFASFDWLMSLEPQWFSTIFGVYVFSGMTLAALAAVTLGVVWMRAKGWLPEDLVTRDHLYSLGALLFAFTCFWAYIAFSQYMLIWYGNLPEETFWFADRFENGWLAVSWLLAGIRFVVPFFLLLPRAAKMDPKRLAQASVIVLAGQWIDLFWLIMPSAHGDAPTFGWQELGPSLLLTGILVVYVAWFLGRRRLVAVGDPLFEKSRHFHL